MNPDETVALGIYVIKDGLFKRPRWVMTDGVDTISGETATFTINELKAKFPYFFKEEP